MKPPKHLTPALQRWIDGSKIVEPDGAPLVCFHGTDKDFNEFASHALTSVYRVGSLELQRADSWDMGDERRGAPAGFHHMALSWSQTLGVEAALKMHLAEVERHGHQNHPDSRRITMDLRRLRAIELQERAKLVVGTESRPTGDGFYFTPDPAYGFIRDIGQRPGGHVMPVYLAIRNPIFVNASQIEGAGAAFNVEKYRSKGYDGAIFADHTNDLRRRGWNGSCQIVAFDARQIKSALGNSGLYDRDSPNITDSHDWEREQAVYEMAQRCRYGVKDDALLDVMVAEGIGTADVDEESFERPRMRG